MRFKDITGLVINGYLVVKQNDWLIEKGGRRRALWTFQCQCGTEFIASSYAVSSGHNVCPSCRPYGRYQDITGKTFGRLVVLQRVSSRGSRATWATQCSNCGDKFLHVTEKLYRLKHCPCMVGKGGLKHGHTKKGGARTPTYSSWAAMMSRCYQPSYPKKEYYSTKGIKVCERWHNFENFLADMGERPEGKTLGRIDHDKDYAPNNCRWETWVEQNQGRNRDHKGRYKG